MEGSDGRRSSAEAASIAVFVKVAYVTAGKFNIRAVRCGDAAATID